MWNINDNNDIMMCVCELLILMCVMVKYVCVCV